MEGQGEGVGWLGGLGEGGSGSGWERRAGLRTWAHTTRRRLPARLWKSCCLRFMLFETQRGAVEISATCNLRVSLQEGNKLVRSVR